MLSSLRPLLGIGALVFAAHASAQVTFYEGEGFRGRVFETDRPVWNMEREGYNDRAASVIVDRGQWEVCEDARFEGRCVVLRPGSYDSLRGLGMYKRISSVRPVEDRHDREAPEPLVAPTYEYRRRPSESLIEVPITSARAVVGPPEQRCWMEHQQAAPAQSERRDINVPGALIGGVLGGILGHQFGGGRGQTITTIGGAVGGSALGANIDRLTGQPVGQPVPTTEVRRCETVAASGPPQYWEVTYDYRGVEHRAQMSTPPGRTLLVNREGEPRL